MNKDFKGIEEKLGIHFKSGALLKEALTHRSYLNEHPDWPVSHNERLEYLGDAVIELITTDFLFKKFPERQEGELTSFRAALVNYQMMGKVAREITLDAYLYLSKGEAKDSGKAREVILANAFEALIGAVYLDAGYEKTKDFVERVLVSHLQEVIEEGLYQDPKSLLQEIVQEKLKLTPTYRVLTETGPDHQKKFTVGVFFGDTLSAEGEGTSKQEAESNAARQALASFEGEDKSEN